MQLQTAISIVPAGEFMPRAASIGQLGVAAKLGIGAAVVALLAASAAAAALLLWLFSVLLPVAVGAGVVAYAAFRIQFGTRARPRTNVGF